MVHLALLWGRTEMDKEFWWGNLKEKGLFEDPGLDGRVSLKYYLDLTEIGWKDMD